MTQTRQQTERGTIGVFDSGVGGLSVVRALVQLMPSQPLSYVADNANCPYGPRPASEIIAFSEGITRYLQTHGSEVVVVACNTASAAALAPLRQAFPEVSFVGMVPAIKPAAALTKSGGVGVLATEGTLQGSLFETVVEHWADGVRVVSRACSGLVELVESGDVDSAETEAILRICLEPLLAEGIDVLVLGCTHYPFLIPTLLRLLPSGVQVIEPSQAIAQQTQRMLSQRGLLVPEGEPARRRYAATGAPTAMQRALRDYLGERACVDRIRWHRGRLTQAQATGSPA